jgi:hypothetical protein
MENSFKETLDEVIAEGQYKTARKMLEIHTTFSEYEKYMKKLDRLSKE